MTRSYQAIPLAFDHFTESEMRVRSQQHLLLMQKRRSVRSFASKPVPRDVVENVILAAATAPSGAHQQPWTFVLISDPDTKAKLRAAAEEEERQSYGARMSPEWLAALAPLGTDWHKPHLTDAPFVLVVFEQVYGLVACDEGPPRRVKHYYVQESVGIAVGFLIAALHQVGLATLTHTPSPMGFLRTLLGRPDNERPFVVMPIGYPAADATVPDLERKSLAEILIDR